MVLILGISLGLLLGIKYRYNMKKKLSKESVEVSTTYCKEPQYEELELDKPVTMSENVSYDVLRK